MNINGMCPFCYIKQKFKKPSKVTQVYGNKPYASGVVLTPPMGWSSWNTFKNRIDEDLIYEMAVAIKEKGLEKVGYNFINLDDNWHSSMRDESGNLQGDLTTFSRGIAHLVQSVNKLGFKVGIYSSNGTTTCEDLPASLYRERQDALTFARWGIEYFKYDYCHNEVMSGYAPLVYSITVAMAGQSKGTEYLCDDAKLFGYAKYMPCNNLPSKKYVSGLDRNYGAMEYKINVEEDGEYVLTVNIKKKGKYAKCLMAQINEYDTYIYDVPSQNEWNVTARFQRVVKLVKGSNTIRLFNPVATSGDSAMLQYKLMGECLLEASKQVAKETGKPVKPMAYSLCEWGKNKPWQWGANVGNLWRTTPDISPHWLRIMFVYNINVKLHAYAGVSAYNDPDMLEVGNGKLTYDENISHFSLWCMMNAPLILGCDIRIIADKVLDIVTNKNLIAINQDKLCKQAKRIRSGGVDVLIKPLENSEMAICLFNSTAVSVNYSIKMKGVFDDEYSNLANGAQYQKRNLWTDEVSALGDKLEAKLAPHASVVYKIFK